ncbi:lytic murein transglycosylase [Parasulfuritortus cantonensis]|nr:lytic murein transglycosylase [Parasulfuritortus cantonensis]
MWSRNRLFTFAPAVVALCLAAAGADAEDAAGAAAPPSGVPAPGTPEVDQAARFQAWLDEFRRQAAAQGISQATLDAALTGLQPLDRVLERDQSQPEFVQTFLDYLNKRVSDRRVEKGGEALAGQAERLGEAERRYGVPARYLVAFWGLETNYGGYLGDVPVVAALATLAYDARRPEFFRSQLLDALRIIDRGDVGAGDLVGSWAGAIGHMQFIPSTYLAYAVDGDGDGRVDLRNSLPDAIESAANYLHEAGWRSDQEWGLEVRLPDGFDASLAGLERRQPRAAWAALGLRRADGSPLADADEADSLVLPQGISGPAFLVSDNFRVILRWNRSLNYAIAVGHLADRLAGGAPLATGLQADNRPLSRDQMETVQKCLAALGYDPGTPDGIPGSRTRTAIRAYQKAAGLPADGYPSLSLLEHLEDTLLEQEQPLPDGTMISSDKGPA